MCNITVKSSLETPQIIQENYSQDLNQGQVIHTYSFSIPRGRPQEDIEMVMKDLCRDAGLGRDSIDAVLSEEEYEGIFEDNNPIGHCFIDNEWIPVSYHSEGDIDELNSSESKLAMRIEEHLIDGGAVLFGHKTQDLTSAEKSILIHEPSTHMVAEDMKSYWGNRVNFDEQPRVNSSNYERIEKTLGSHEIDVILDPQDEDTIASRVSNSSKQKLTDKYFL